ncbi:plasmalemma vesicle associated protein a isoform X2 [Conger conger]|uniref:plasmalemma vesicle associated protein a isoform X2 n=1 Tax=Conger conger TaxID=82655 RepID=UPI002A5A4889|nr:plasmalemma vesicle associated protein a isoform X2 [Conger conger]
MYSSYPQAKFALDTKKMQKSKAKSCGYYWRIIFLFSSLIQSLIIVSLVLFMVYGHPEQSSEEKRVQDLQHNFMKLTTENKALQQVKGNLTRVLNTTLTKKLKDDQDLQKLRRLTNISIININNLNYKLYMCETEKKNMPRISLTPCTNKNRTDNLISQLQAMYQLLSTNFTQTVKHLNRELEVATRARDDLRLESISLRRNATDLQRQLSAYSAKCKGDFVQSLNGIQAVTRAFIARIAGLFPAVLPFQLTCEKQRDQLQQIHSNCSRLSQQVEDKFQSYLDNVGSQVSSIQAQSSRLQVQNDRLQEDLRWCQQNRSAELALNSRRRQEAQAQHDREVERLLQEQKKLHEERELHKHTITLKTSEINLLTNNILTLNMSLRNCIPKPPPARIPWLYQPYASPGPPGARPGQTFLATVKNPPERTRQGPTDPGVYTKTPGQGSSFYSDVQKHVKELQEMANKDSGVSG